MLCLLSSGSNAQGQLGNNTSDDCDTFRACRFNDESTEGLPIGASNVIEVATGSNHTLVLLEMQDKTRNLWGCGDGRKGQLGRKYQEENKISTIFRRIRLSLEDSGLDGYHFKHIGATWETSFVAMSRDGSNDILISLGSDDFGNLGVGGLTSKSSRKDFYPVHLGQWDHLIIENLFTGPRHIILKLKTNSSSRLVGWGAARHGQLGEPADIAILSRPRLLSFDSVSFCSLGMQHTVILHTSGHISSFGSNRKGQLQVANSTDKFAKVGCTWNGTYVVREIEGSWGVISSGSNSHGQLGWHNNNLEHRTGVIRFPEALNYLDLACGSEHVLVLATSSKRSEIWGWGWNEHGNLGLGHTKDVSCPVKLWPSSDEHDAQAKKIWAGLGTSWILADVDEFVTE